jgi:hypothetical protein
LHEPKPEEAGFGYVPFAHMKMGEERQKEAQEKEEEAVRNAERLWDFYEADRKKKK